MEEIDLYDLLRFYAKKWLTIATFVMLGGIAGVGYTYFVQTPAYTSKAQLLLIGNTRTSASDSVVLNNYVQLFTSNRVLGSVASEQDYSGGYDRLAANTSAENVKNTDIINVAVSTSDAKQSKALLDNAIDTFRKQAKTLYGDNNVKINVVDGASVPASPANIKPVVQIGLATMAGFGLAIVSLFFVYDYRASRRGKSSKEDVEILPKNTATDKSVEAKLAALEPAGEEIMFGVSTEQPPETPKVIKKSRKTIKKSKK